MLIMVMIGLPVLVISGFGTVLSTTTVSPAERLHWELGGATAKIIAAGGQVVQSADGSSWTGGGHPKTDAGAKRRGWTSADIARAVGGNAYRVDSGTIAVAQDGRPLLLPALTLDAGGFAATGIAALKTGSWPTATDQVVVSPELIARGLPADGTIQVTVGDAARTLTVVGTAEATNDRGEPYGLMGLTGAFGTFAEQHSEGFLVIRPAPITWPEIEQLNAEGMVVVAPEFVQHPDRADLTGPYAAQTQSNDESSNGILIALIFALLLETTLLAGPAFAVSTARRRRTLALVASNGGTRQQLRRYVLGQGLVMGVLAALSGAALGVAAPAIGFPLADHLVGGRVARGPFQPNWPVLAAAAAAAVAAALVAAAIAARGTSRLDIAQTLAGRSLARSRHGVRRLAPPIIAALVTTGALAGCAIIAAAPDPQRMMRPAVGLGILATLGSLSLVGTVLDLVGLLGHGPLAVRLALRDGRRNRSRTLPAVAAITATVTVLTMLTIANTSTIARQVRDYTPQAPRGDGLVYVFPSRAHGRDTLAEIRRQHPDWHIEPISYLGADLAHPGKQSDQPDRQGHPAALIPAGCSPSAVLAGTAQASCIAGYDLLVAPVDAAVHKLPAKAAAAITGGSAVLVDNPHLVHDGHVTLALTENGKVRTRTLPALLVPVSTLTQAFPGRERATPWIPPKLATRLQLPSTQVSSLVHDPDGPITVAQEQAINERVTGVGLQVERGPLVGTIRLLLIGMLTVGSLLALAAALIATALGRAESRADLATYSAVGASTSALRHLTAAQALLICLIGMAQGLLTGLLPGMALAAALTSHTANGLPPRPIIQIPWARLLGGLAAAALLAGLLAALTLRRLPLVRRLE